MLDPVQVEVVLVIIVGGLVGIKIALELRLQTAVGGLGPQHIPILARVGAGPDSPGPGISHRGMGTTISLWGGGVGAGASFTLGGLLRRLGGDVLGLFKISHLQRMKKRASSDVRFPVWYEVLG